MKGSGRAAIVILLAVAIVGGAFAVSMFLGTREAAAPSSTNTSVTRETQPPAATGDVDDVVEALETEASSEAALVTKDDDAAVMLEDDASFDEYANLYANTSF